MKKSVAWTFITLLILSMMGYAQEDDGMLTIGALKLEQSRRLLGNQGAIKYSFFEGASLMEAELKEGDTEIDLILIPHTQVYRFMASGTLVEFAPISGQKIGWQANEALFNQLGLEVPDAGWTWADLLALAREAKAKDSNIYALPVGTEDTILYQYAALHVDATAGILDHDAELLKEILVIHGEMLEENLVPREFSFSHEGQYLFKPCPYMEGILPLPRLAIDGFDILDYEGYYIGIYSGSDQIEEAQELLVQLAIPIAEDALPVGGMLHFASDLPAIADRYIAGEIYIDVAVSEIRKSLRSRLAD